MTRRIRFRCPDCRQSFPWNPSSLPNYCPICGSYVGLDAPPDAPFEPKAPAIGKRVHSADIVYRQMEQASINRARQAADLAGVPESEMSHLKITNMKDNLREGDTAAMPVNNPTSRFMQQNSAVVTQAQLAGAQFASNTRVGPYPGAGDAIRRSVASQHPSIRAAIESQGRRG